MSAKDKIDKAAMKAAAKRDAKQARKDAARKRVLQDEADRVAAAATRRHRLEADLKATQRQRRAAAKEVSDGRQNPFGFGKKRR